LGKRILKSVQKLLQAAVQAEAELTNGPVDVQALFDELDRMIDSSLELKQPAVPVTNAEMLEDEPMPDAPQDGQIVVVHSRQGNSTTYQEDAPVADGDIKEEAGTDADEDAMNIDTVPPVADGPDDSSAPAAPVTEQSEDFNSLTATLDRAVTSAASKPSGITQTSSPPHSHVADANSPPTAAPQPQSQPLTPPRSLTNGNPNAPDALNEGGVPWYLHDLDIEGTTLGEDLVAATLSDEELSEMDDETLNDLGFDVNDSTISVADVPVKKGRPNPANFRKGTRSSARRR
jgi:NuA3 HAT complex component NTO1